MMADTATPSDISNSLESLGNLGENLLDEVIQVYCEPTPQQRCCFTFGCDGLLDWVHSLSLSKLQRYQVEPNAGLKALKVSISQNWGSEPAEVFCCALSAVAILPETIGFS